jgi:hypothetical protein
MASNLDFILFIALAINSIISLAYFIWYRNDLGTSSTILIALNVIFLIILSFRLMTGYTPIGNKVSEIVDKQDLFKNFRSAYPKEIKMSNGETLKHIKDSKYVGQNDIFDCPQAKDCKPAGLTASQKRDILQDLRNSEAFKDIPINIGN